MLDLSSSATHSASMAHQISAPAVAPEGLHFVDPAAPYKVGSSTATRTYNVSGPLTGRFCFFINEIIVIELLSVK